MTDTQTRSQEEGLLMLGQIADAVSASLDNVAPRLEFAIVFWNRGDHANPKSTVMFARAEAHPVAIEALRTAALSVETAIAEQATQEKTDG